MIPARANPISLAVHCAPTGDHNALAMAGALSLGAALSQRLGIPASILGAPGPILHADWETELARAMPALSRLARHLDSLLQRKQAPLLALSRCAAALATLPVVMRHRPDACVVWLDAHGDLNTPQTSISGYLGGMALAGPAGLWDSGLGAGLPLASIILVGARDLDPAEQALVDGGAVSLVPADADCLARLHDALAGRPAYVHIDCDVLAPGIVPTDYRVPGGFTLTALHAVCELLAESATVGLEIAEYENAWPENGEPASPAALLDALEPLIARLASSPRTGPKY